MSTGTTLPRFMTRIVTMLAIAVGLTTAFAGTAAAHTSLTGSDPAEAATVTQAPTTVTLTFNQEVSVLNPVIVVTGPDSTQYQVGTVIVDRDSATTGLNPLGTAGTYSVAYRVISADGHPVEGQYTFEYAAQPSQPAEATPEPAAAPTSTAGGAAGTGSSTIPPSTTPAAASDTAGSSTATPASAVAAEPAGTSSWIYIALAATAALAIAAVAVYVMQQRRNVNRR